MKRALWLVLLLSALLWAQLPEAGGGGVGPATIQSGQYLYGASAVGTDAYAISLAPAILSYTTGMVVHFKADVANTGACSLALNGLAAKAIKRGHDVDPADGEIEIGTVVTVAYDGTNWQMQSQTGLAGGAPGGFSNITTSTRVLTASGSGQITESPFFTLSASPVLAYLYDSTGGTGVTSFVIRAGALQGTNPLQAWWANGGTTLAQINASGVFQFGNSLDVGLSRNAAGISEINSGTAGKQADLILGKLTATPLATPGALTVTPTCVAACTQTWTYKVTAIIGDGVTTTDPGPTGTSGAAQNATLSSSNKNVLTWAAITGATSYDVWMTASGGTPATLGKVANVATNTYSHEGANGDGGTIPTTNATGQVQANVYMIAGQPFHAAGTGIGWTGGLGGSWTPTLDTAYAATNASIQSATAITCLDTSVGVDDYACDPLPVITAYPTTTNILQLWLTPTTANTTDATLNVHSLGPKKILKDNGSALATNDLRVGIPYLVVWDAGGDGGAGAFMLSSLTGNAPLGASDAAVFTNKTYDAEGTGNVLTTVSYLTIPGFSFKLPTALAPAIVSIEGSNTILDTLEWPDADGDYSAQFVMPLPPDWDAGTVVAAIRWAPAAAATGNVVWQLATTCVAPGETVDKAYNAVQTVTSAAPTGTEFVDAAIASVTMTGCAPNEEWWLKVLRNRTHASDTLNQKPQLNWLQLKVRRAQ